MLGAILLVTADIGARYLIMPEEVPVGVMTAIIGIPIFSISREGGSKNEKLPHAEIGKGGISLLIGKKALFSFMILLVLTACAVVLSAGVGKRFISPGAVAKTFLGMGDPGDDLIIMSFRMPRILVALFAGICLAAAGSILQGLIRNPLASPDIIGVTGGASVAVVLFLMLFSDKNNALTVSISWLPVAAFVGAALAGMLVYFLSYKNSSSTFRLVLIGIGFRCLPSR